MQQEQIITPKPKREARKPRKKTRCFIAGGEISFPTFEYEGKQYVSGYDIHSSTKTQKNVKIDNEFRSITEILKRKNQVLVFFSKDLRNELPPHLHNHITCNKSGKFIPLEEITKEEGRFYEYLIKRMAFKFDNQPIFIIKLSKPKLVPEEYKKKRSHSQLGKSLELPKKRGNKQEVLFQSQPLLITKPSLFTQQNPFQQNFSLPPIHFEQQSVLLPPIFVPETPKPVQGKMRSSLMDLISVIHQEEKVEQDSRTNVDDLLQLSSLLHQEETNNSPFLEEFILEKRRVN